MASVSNVLRTCGLLFYLFLKVCNGEHNATFPWIVNFQVEKKNCVDSICKYLLHVRGGPYLGHYSWRLTPAGALKGSVCNDIYPNYEIKEIDCHEWDTRLEIVVPNLYGKLYFCLHHPQVKNSPLSGKYLHQGADLFLDPRSDGAASYDGPKTWALKYMRNNVIKMVP